VVVVVGAVVVGGGGGGTVEIGVGVKVAVGSCTLLRGTHV
jgi:hypothetical protein